MTCTGRSFTILAAAAVAAIAVLSAASPADAGARTSCDKQRDAADTRADRNYHTVISADGTKTFVVERPIIVCGAPPKPQVVYVLQQRSIEYRRRLLERGFVDRILSSVNRELFR